MIIDAHHHLWVYNTREYEWMDSSMEVLQRDYLPDELRVQAEQAGVTGTVAIQARQSLEETSWLLEQSLADPLIKGVVGWADLCSPAVEEQLEEFSDHPGLVGIRHVIHDEPDDGFMLRPAFLKGIELLGTFNLTYDLLLFPKHLDKACELVRMFPGQRFVLDHMAKPHIKSGIVRPWREDIQALAVQPNVWCKISGMVTEADHRGWKQGDFVPYMEVVTEAFGLDRVMLGSDWPVCRLAGEYREVMGIPEAFFCGLGKDEKRRVYSQNAMECYCLRD